MAFSGLRGASSGLLAVLKKGSRLRKRKPAKSGPPALPEPAPAIASLATLTKIINAHLDPADVNRVKEAYRFSDPAHPGRSEEHTSELPSLMRISFALFCQ